MPELKAKLSRAAKTLRAWGDPRQLGYLIVFVTNRCNFLCDFCFYNAEIVKGRKPDELTAEELDLIARRAGPLLQLSLTGGEPFLRRDLDAIAASFAEHTGVRYVTIPTNGWFGERIEGFLEATLPRFPATNFRLVLSVDGIGAAHDEARRAPGSWERLRDTFGRVDPLRRRFGNLVLDANTVYNARSEATVVETLRWLDAEMTFDNLSLTYARGNIADPSLRARTRTHYAEARAFLEARTRRREQRFLSSVWRAVDDVSHDHLVRTVFEDEYVTPCVAARKLAVLGETGDVFPCEILGKRIGNVRDFDFDLGAVLASPAGRELADWIHETRCKCSFECAHAANVVWSRGAYPDLLKAVARNLATLG